MISLDIVSLVAYLIPGYLISAARHYAFIGKRDKETSRAVESIVVSILFFACLSNTHTCIGILNAAQAGDVFSGAFFRHLPFFIAFILIGAIIYSGGFYLWIIFSEQVLHRSRFRTAFASFSKPAQKSRTWYFKMDGDPCIYRGVLEGNDLDESNDIMLINIEVGTEQAEQKKSKYQFFADEMLINREKAVYLFTRNGGE